MSNREGFTIVEVLVAIIVLGVGIVALVGSSALVTRMIGDGKRSTGAVQVAQARMETLRQSAAATTPTCTNLNAGTGSAQDGATTVEWTVTAPAGMRTVQVIAIYPTGRGVDTLALNTLIRCG